MRHPYSFLAAAMLAVGCGHDPTGPARHAGDRYGGVFTLNETEVLRSIFPLGLTQASAYRIAAQFYQGLVAFDPRDLSIVPCLADRWEVDPSGTRYTFHLREGVYFHDDPAFPDGQGRAVTAEDVARCFTAVCKQGTGDQMFWLFQDRILGANTSYAAKPGSSEAQRPVPGIEVVDEHTVRLTLTQPSPTFLRTLAHPGCWIYPEELLTAYGNDLQQHAIGTGPFRLKLARAGGSMVLERNARYWDRDEQGRQLPYLDAVKISFEPAKEKEIEEFIAGKLSTVSELSLASMRLLGDSIDRESGKPRFMVRSAPALAVQFYGFNATKPPFNDVRVRRAIALAIDRRVLVDSVLLGMAIVADHGLVPPGLVGYPYALVPGVPFAPDSARKLLAEAGYPDGKGFPRIQLQVNSDGFGYSRVAGEVQNMLQRELHLAVTISVMSANQHYERIESGAALLWREGWIADHPDAENFLMLLYGKNAITDTSKPASLNNTRYANPAFDSLFTRAQHEMDEPRRLNDLARAEHTAMEDMPVAPLYYERCMVLLQPWVRDLHVNPIEYLDLTRVWFDRDLRPQDGRAAMNS